MRSGCKCGWRFGRKVCFRRHIFIKPAPGAFWLQTRPERRAFRQEDFPARALCGRGENSPRSGLLACRVCTVSAFCAFWRQTRMDVRPKSLFLPPRFHKTGPWRILAANAAREDGFPTGGLCGRRTFRQGDFPAGELSGRRTLRKEGFPAGGLSGGGLSGKSTFRHEDFPAGELSGRRAFRQGAFRQGGFPAGGAFRRGGVVAKGVFRQGAFRKEAICSREGRSGWGAMRQRRKFAEVWAANLPRLHGICLLCVLAANADGGLAEKSVFAATFS